MTHSHSHSRKSGFTLIELLVVIAIIALLAGLLFPTFKRAQENGYQANCASNLKGIYTAVQLYRQDEKAYPSSLTFLLPTDFTLEGGVDNTGGTGNFKGGRDGLICKDDDLDDGTFRSSYGDIFPTAVPAVSPDMSRFVWNYWGYRGVDNAAKCSATDASGCAGTAYQSSTDASAAASNLFFDPALVYNERSNPLKYSLSNRFAPTSTIITHCVYHRLPTASGNLDDPWELASANVKNARDIVLRLDGSAKSMDVSLFHTNSNWSKQNF